jgi:uncharacterized protein
VTSPSSDRSSVFPAIERKYGQPVSHWFELLSSLGDARYPEMMALLQGHHGFSRAHANAVVQWHRGSTSPQRFEGPQQFLTGLTLDQAATARAILAAIEQRYPHLELVMAWNQPMLRRGRDYVFGLSVATRHLTLNPWSTQVLEHFRERLAAGGHRVNKHTFVVPLGWNVDADLLCDLVGARLAEAGHPLEGHPVR